MVWNTIVHPKMMGESQSGGPNETPMPLKYVSTGKQNVYDLILNFNPFATLDEAVTIAYGDYDDLCAKLVRGELILCTSVSPTKLDDMVGIKQDYSALPFCRKIEMWTNATIHGKPVISINFTGTAGSSFIIDCNNAIYVEKLAPFDPAEPDVPSIN